MEFQIQSPADKHKLRNKYTHRIRQQSGTTEKPARERSPGVWVRTQMQTLLGARGECSPPLGAVLSSLRREVLNKCEQSPLSVTIHVYRTQDRAVGQADYMRFCFHNHVPCANFWVNLHFTEEAEVQKRRIVYEVI